jgi:hypothetical protein
LFLLILAHADIIVVCIILPLCRCMCLSVVEHAVSLVLIYFLPILDILI